MGDESIQLYILDDNGNPVEVEETEEGAKKWYEFREDYKRRHVKTTNINGYKIATVFLGQDIYIGEALRKNLWGTVMRRDSDRKYVFEEQFATKEEALECHDKLVEAINKETTSYE